MKIKEIKNSIEEITNDLKKMRDEVISLKDEIGKSDLECKDFLLDRMKWILDEVMNAENQASGAMSNYEEILNQKEENDAMEIFRVRRGI